MCKSRSLTPEQLFCLEGCSSFKQYCKMYSDFESGVCTFCQLDRTLNEVLFEDKYAMAWHVPPAFLRPTLRVHGIVVPKRHVRFIGQLCDDEVLSIHRLMRNMNGMFAYQGGLWHAREGDMRFNAGTVPHVHYNIFEPNQTGEVRVPVFKEQTDRAANQARAAARYEAGERA
jgi:diadenosine tetraphosphate (Ap4A) HIT family hydrolase